MKKEPENSKQQTKSDIQSLGKSIDSNIMLFENIFKDDGTFTVRRFEDQETATVKCCIMFIEGMINTEILNENIIRPIMQSRKINPKGSIARLQEQVLLSNITEKTQDVDLLVQAIIRGDTAFLLDGSQEALIIGSKGWQTRSISEPEAERTVRGSREGFVESIMINLTLIRRKLGTPKLKIKFLQIGVQSNTKVCICYIEGIANPKILDELQKRIKDIDIDGMLATGYIEEFIKDAPFSPLKTIGSSERPDVVAARLLEGRIAILVDGTPLVLTIPYLFMEYFQANEDYYINYYYSSINRLLRVLGFALTTCIPAIYVALVSFHQEMIPTPLLLSISAARQGVPFPTIIETLILLFVFEMLREAGTRMPTNIGQALSIVGALVLGQASVEAKIVSAPVVIIVAVSAITSLMLPRFKGTSILLRVVFLLFSSFLGLYGLTFGIAGFVLHLCGIRSFGIPYMLHITSLDIKDLKDTAIRTPWWYMKLRPKLITAGNRIRQGGRVRKS